MTDLKKIFISKIITSSCVLIFLIISIQSGFSQETPDLKKKCEEKCLEVLSMIKSSGIELTFKEINNKDGKFVWDDSFVYAIDINKGIILSHNNRRMIGELVSEISNINGRKIFREFMDKGERDGRGWVTYMWKKRLKYVQRYTFVAKVPGHDILVLSSTYNKTDDLKDNSKKEKSGVN